MIKMSYLFLSLEGYFKISFMMVEVENLDANSELIYVFFMVT